jgi:hypothetical protein
MNTKAVLGEVYLERNEYANAAKYLKMACESYENDASIYKVDKSFTKEAWKNIFIGAEGQLNENISTVAYNLNEDQINPLPKWLMASDMYLAKPAQALVDSFKVQVQLNKLIGDAFRGQGISYDTIASGDTYISKYSLDKGVEFSTDIILSRATDLHLELAEALNRAGDEKTALILLNAGFAGEKTLPPGYLKTAWGTNLGVRGRAYLASRTVPKDLVGNERMDYVEDLIMDERAMELAFEGKRWFDLVRIATRRGTPEYLADKVAAKYSDPAIAEQVRIKLMNPANWYLPLQK